VLSCFQNGRPSHLFCHHELIVVGQQFASIGHIVLWPLTACTCKMFQLKDWEPNKLWAQK
jgi:hypothetical protein